MDYKQEIAKYLVAHLKISMSESDIYKTIEVPKNSDMGDFAFPCFMLAKELKKAPAQIASDLVKNLTDLPTTISKVAAAGPYLNFLINKSAMASDLIPQILSASYQSQRKNTGLKTMIEFSQPNTHKGFHVGHTRNVSLGDALVRLRRWYGDEVIAANYIGDVGAHIAKVLWYLDISGESYDTYAKDMTRGEFLGQLYTKADSLLNFKLLTKAPHLNVVSAKIVSVKVHDKNKSWNVVVVNDGTQDYQVICALSGYKVGDIVAFAKPSARIKGRKIEVTQKDGLESQGMLCSPSEISVDATEDALYLFPSNTAVGVEVADLLQIDSTVKSAAQTMREREKGVSEVLQKLEKEEPAIHQKWLETKDWSMQDFYEIYAWLNVKFDHYFFESDVAKPGKDIVKKYLNKGVFKKDEGAVGVDLSAHNLPFFLVLKSDGTGLYSTKDLALAELKFEEFQIDQSIYVVAAEQNLHFQQVFQTLELMGYSQAKKCKHLSYGMVVGPDGKLSSRKGNVVLLNEHRKILAKQIYNDYLKNYTNIWSAEEIEAAIRKISLATIKYGMLNQDNNKNITFDINEWTAKSGNTGPYMLYAYARTQSILREVEDKFKFDINAVDYSLLKHATEEKLLNKMSQFVDITAKAAERYEPQILCIYLYELAKDFSRMYDNCSVLHAETAELRNTRYQVVAACGKILDCGLDLIGIETLERM